ncbi:MAG: hypothetical protein VKQ33_07120 [Candidatus Sericytochromatia bacterium]|nr:hypothetical protein [Candidatus Sericytochromatia bacterium]
MTDVKKTPPGTAPLPVPPPPPPPPAPRAAPAQRAARPAAPAGDTNFVKTSTGPLAPPKPIDLDRILAATGQALNAVGNLAEPTQTVSDTAANAADVVLNAEEAAKVVKGLPKVTAEQNARFASAVEGAAKAGKVAGAAGAAVAAHALFQAVHPELNLKDAGEALTNLALGLATALEDVAPEVLGKAGFGLGAVSALFALGTDIADAAENGANTSNVMGMVGNALAAAGSIASLVPGGQPLGAALLMAGAGVNLARLAYDNREAIAGVAGQAADAIGGAAGQAADAIAGAAGQAADAIGGAADRAVAAVGGFFGLNGQEDGPRQSTVAVAQPTPTLT